MKKKSLLVFPLLLVTGVSLCACNGGDTSTTTETTTEEVSTSIEKKDDYNDISKTCKLDKSYNGTNFKEDGIEEATLVAATDGDTASFKTKSGDRVTIRFFAIDTPESTGSVEKWGKSASKFTKNKLESAYALLLEASTTPASVDSYGSRYLAYVWYKETADSDWVNLNLEIVENGYSKNKCLQTKEYIYYKYFAKAEDFAKNVPLHIWSEEEDPYYSTDATEVTVKELCENAANYYDSATSVGSKVRFTGYVTSTTVSSTGTYMYHVSDNDDEGNVYTFNVYAGYASTSIPTYMKIGGQFQITGSMQLYSNSWQVSGLTYVPMQKGGDYLTRNSKTYYMTFNTSVAEGEDASLYFTEALFNSPVVKTATVTGTTLTITADCVNPAKESLNKTYTFETEVASDFNAASLVGKTFTVAGIQPIEDSGVIQVLKYSNFSFK